MISKSEELAAICVALGRNPVNFEILLEAMPEALVGVDQAGAIQFVNRHAEALFGYDRGDLVGQLIETLVPASFGSAHTGFGRATPWTRELGFWEAI